MKGNKTIRISLLAVTLIFANTPQLHAEFSATSFFQRIWGDTYLTTGAKKRKIIARRIALAAASVAAAGATAYALWNYFCATTTHPVFGCIFKPDQKTQAAIPSAELVQPYSAQQGYNECGLVALANARAIEELVQTNSRLTSTTIAEACRRHVAELRHTRTQLRNDDLQRNTNEPLSATGRMLEQQDIVRLNNEQTPFFFVGRDHNNRINIVGADGFPNNYTHNTAMRNFAGGQRNAVHFLLNHYNGHWTELSLTRRAGQQPLALHLNSANYRTRDRESQGLFGFINRLLQQQATA